MRGTKDVELLRSGKWLQEDAVLPHRILAVEELRDRFLGTAWDAELFATALVRQDFA